MLWAYWQQRTGRQGPMNTVQDAYSQADERGLYPREFVELAKKVGLLSASFEYPLTARTLDALITTHGPMWCAGYWWGTSAGHIIVLTGVSNDLVHLNDPAPQGKGSKKTKPIGVFNSQLANTVAGCLMYKDPNRY